MDLSVFFTNPVSPDFDTLPAWVMGRKVAGLSAFPDWQKADVVLLGVPDAEEPSGMAQAIREALYSLSTPDQSIKLVDLGDFKPKDEMDSYEDALSYVMEQLLEAGKTVMILADKPGFSFAQYRAYEHFDEDVSYVHVGAVLDLDAPFEANPHVSYNQRILRHEPNYLFGYTQLGYQRYFADPEAIKLLSDLHCAAIRYGEIEADLEEIEPYMRDASLVSIDLSSMRASDMQGANRPSPAGFSVQEMCRLTRYAGLSDQVSSVMFSGMDPLQDNTGLSAKTTALALWYFLDGRSQRHSESPESGWRRYSVTLDSPPHQIDFLESTRSGRWWMEVPYTEALNKPGAGPVKRVACSRKDYEAAQQDEIPDRWWQTHYRLG